METVEQLKNSLPNLHSAAVSDIELHISSMHEDPRKLGCVGASEVGKLFTRAGLSAKTAHSFAYEKALELINGYRDFVSTNAMLHGINSEIDAYRDVVLEKYPHAQLRSDVSIFIQEIDKKCYWASPDVTDHVEGITIDIKCPYTPYTFWNNVYNLPEQYKAQNQMQMMATSHEKGAICLYLTGSEIDTYGNKKEYKIDPLKRSKFIYQDADRDFQKEIVERINGFFPMRDLIFRGLTKAPEISDEELFDLCENSDVKKFKENTNLLMWNHAIVKCSDEYYTFKAK